jgi:hypothetical protein
VSDEITGPLPNSRTCTGETRSPAVCGRRSTSKCCSSQLSVGRERGTRSSRLNAEPGVTGPSRTAGPRWPSSAMARPATATATVTPASATNAPGANLRRPMRGSAEPPSLATHRRSASSP